MSQTFRLQRYLEKCSQKGSTIPICSGPAEWGRSGSSRMSSGSRLKMKMKDDTRLESDYADVVALFPTTPRSSKSLFIQDRDCLETVRSRCHDTCRPPFGDCLYLRAAAFRAESILHAAYHYIFRRMIHNTCVSSQGSRSQPLLEWL